MAAAAYRSGEKLVNEWDGLTHDYTKKGGVVHTEIMLPAHAPPEFQDRSTLWNSVEQIEKSSDAQLAREIEVALPVELSRAEQLALVRAFVKDHFVDAGMCADFAIHDRGTGNPHAHIMLTIRPIKENGKWGAKCRKVYDLDSQGQRIPNGKGGWKNHREDTTDWNQRGNAEKWRAAWATYTNRALEAAGRPERIDHRSYKRQGVDKIPSVHMGPTASQMERRGIQTEKGNINREIAADNKLLKEIKARITRLYNWSKEQSAQPQGQESTKFRMEAPPLEGRLLPHPCRCEQERLDLEAAEQEARRHRQAVADLKSKGFTDPAMREWTFASDNGKCPQMKHARFYVENWPTMQAENIGYLLWGGVGTGKSYFAVALPMP